jgi:hypothetical protein
MEKKERQSVEGVGCHGSTQNASCSAFPALPTSLRSSGRPLLSQHLCDVRRPLPASPTRRRGSLRLAFDPKTRSSSLSLLVTAAASQGASSGGATGSRRPSTAKAGRRVRGHHPARAHQVCGKGSGLTSGVEQLNCSLRQQVSRLVHKSPLWEYVETRLHSRRRQPRVAADEEPPSRLLLTPDERRREMGRVERPRTYCAGHGRPVHPLRPDVTT